VNANYDLTEFLVRVEANVGAHSLGRSGSYRRWLGRDAGGLRDFGLNPYGCADAANILYTIDRFPRGLDERHAFIETLQRLQDLDTGLFREETHDPIHTTAHCIAALELFDARPLHPISGLAEYRDPDAMENFLDGLDWEGNPWLESHRGAGLFAALVLADEVSVDWCERYFDWLDREADPRTGFFRKACVPELPRGAAGIFPHLAGTFHYLFNLEYGRRPLRHPEALVDTCLEIFEERLFPLGTTIGFAEIDWVYCLTRSLRQKEPATCIGSSGASAPLQSCRAPFRASFGPRGLCGWSWIVGPSSDGTGRGGIHATSGT
jgi:hypothetical protein